MKRILTAAVLLAVSLVARGADLTVDLDVLAPDRTEFGSVILYREGVDGARVVGDYARQLPRRGAQTFTVDVPESEAGETYRLDADGASWVFRMPNAASTLSALIAAQADAGETGPCVVSATAPPNPLPGNLWCLPDGTSFSYRAGGLWHSVSGGGGGGETEGGLTRNQVLALVKPYARTGGDAIALGDTDFGDAFQDSVDINRISYSDPVLTFESHGRDDLAVTIAVSSTAQAPDPYDDGPLTRRVEGVERFEGAMRHTRAIGSATITQGLSNALQLTSLTLPTKDEDQTVRVVVDSEGAKTFQLADLLGKSRVNTNTQASAGNSVTITTDAPGSETISFALRNDGRLWIADADIGTRHTFAVSSW